MILTPKMLKNYSLSYLTVCLRITQNSIKLGKQYRYVSFVYYFQYYYFSNFKTKCDFFFLTISISTVSPVCMSQIKKNSLDKKNNI